MINNIVVEGPNNVGKTTLINKLLGTELFKNWRVEHLTGKSPNTIDFYNATLQNGKCVIYDRHCVGETIYPKLDEREECLTTDQVRDLINRHSGTLFIFVTADYTFIENAYRQKCESINWYYIVSERTMFDDVYVSCVKYPNVLLVNQNDFNFDTFYENITKKQTLVKGFDYEINCPNR